MPSVSAISIHAAREGGDVLISFNAALSSISIHAAREGGDHIGFYVGKTHWISIHAAREGGDPADDVQGLSVLYFNPRRP